MARISLMDSHPTVEALESRWERTLQATRRAASARPAAYRRLKIQAADIIENPVDIDDYFPTVEKLVERLKDLDPGGRGSIFEIFSHRISPSSIWQVRTLRMECRDLLAHLDDFERWRRGLVHLSVVK